MSYAHIPWAEAQGYYLPSLRDEEDRNRSRSTVCLRLN